MFDVSAASAPVSTDSTSATASSTPTAVADAAVLAHAAGGWGTWLREPLLHFVLLGGLLFAADRFVFGRGDDPHTVVVSAQVDQEAKDVFKSARGRDPNAEELEALRRVWLDNEVLYREGLAQQLDKGDTAIRERVIFKALSMVDANTQLPLPADKTLREWFESNRAKYDEPARWDFHEAALGGDSSEAAVSSLVKDLNGGAPGDARASLRVFNGRPHANIVQSYGAELAKALESSPIGEWRALKTPEGWRAMRMDAITPAKAATFEALRGVVLQDWTDATLAAQRTAAVRALAKNYTVVREPAAK